MNQQDLKFEDLKCTFIFRVDKYFLHKNNHLEDYQYVAEYTGNNMWNVHWVDKNNKHFCVDYPTKTVLHALNQYIWILED